METNDTILFLMIEARVRYMNCNPKGKIIGGFLMIRLRETVFLDLLIWTHSEWNLETEEKNIF